MTHAQFHIHTAQGEDKSREERERLSRRCRELEAELNAKLRESDPDADVTLNESGPTEVFHISCDLAGNELSEEITAIIDKLGLTDRASRIIAR